MGDLTAHAATLLFIVLCTAVPAPSAAWSLVAEPTHARVTETGDTSFMCQADVPLDRCQFKLHRRFGGSDYGDGPLIDLSAGPRSMPTFDEHGYGYDYRAAYAGAGLERGQCGVALTRIYFGWFTVGCRARALDGTWNQTLATVFSGHEEPIGMDVFPASASVEVGGSVSVRCEAEKPLEVCRFYTQFLPENGTQFTAVPAANERFEYFGGGLAEGDCGLTFKNVTDELNGIVWCNGITAVDSRDGRATFITVLQPPSPPVLQLSASSYGDGDVLSATCSTSGRPAPPVRWLLGDEPLPTERSAADPAWRWPWELADVNIAVKRTLTPSDDGKKLACVVGERDGMRAEQTVAVRDAQDWELTVTPEHVHTGWPGNATVLCRAPVALSECHFRVANNKDAASGQRVINFDNGYLSSPITERLRSGETIYTAEYHGKGLAEGECGVALTGIFWGRIVVGCRARAPLGRFRYAEMTVYDTSYKPVDLRLASPVITALPGGNATLACTAAAAVTKCRFFLPSGSASYRRSRPVTGRFDMSATALESGRCRATVTGVTERDAGHAWCVADTAEGGEGGRAAALVVVKSPAPPTLRLSAAGAGSRLQATCAALGGIPAPRVTWRLAGEVLRGDDVESAASAPWRWQHQPHDMTQVLTRTLKRSDEGKELVCSVRHPAWDAPVEVKQTIEFAADSIDSTPTGGSGGGRKCPALASSTVDFQCKKDGAPLDCAARMPPGARARQTCKPGFWLDSFQGPQEFVCKATGQWDRRPWTCIPDCGRRNDNRAQTVSVGGTEAKFGEFPWHAAVFLNNSRTQNKPQLVCGGSLVSPKFIVSAAHCFWNFVNGSAAAAAEYKVATGRFGLHWDNVEDSEQRRNVRALHINKWFNGVRLSYAADIAVVEVRAPFELGWATNLICIDWTRDFEHAQLTPGTNGTVPGWGLTEGGKQSETLRYVMLPYIPYDKCRAEAAREYQSFLTTDKICAGFQGKGTSVCPGDSGGGYVFPTERRSSIRYYLRGVVSNVQRARGQTGPGCNTEQISVHTRVSDYLDWLAPIISSDSEDHDDRD